MSVFVKILYVQDGQRNGLNLSKSYGFFLVTWNSLPSSIRIFHALDSVRRHPKTHVFKAALLTTPSG